MRKYLLIILIISFLLQSAVLPSSAFAQESETKTLDVIIVMDTSYSNITTDPDSLREYVTKALFDLFLADADFTPTRVGVIFFGTDANLWEDRLFDSTDKTLASISFPAPRGLTVINKPFQLAYEVLEKNGTFQNGNPSALVYLTDGQPEDDNKPGSQETERNRLFSASRPWVEKLAQNGTRLYVITYGNAALGEPQWKDFADLTRGDYHPVKSLQEATDIYVQIVAQALLGYNPRKALDPVKMRPFAEQTATILVPPVTNRLIVFTLRYDPATEIFLYDPHGNLVKDTSENVVVRGGERDSRDKVWRINYPEAGKWIVKFTGGTSNVEAWYFFRPYAIKRIYPNENNVIKPGDPLVIKVRLEDLNKKEDISGDLTADLKLSIQVTDPQSSVTSSAIPMEYDPVTGEFSFTYGGKTREGRYVIQYILTADQESFTIAKEIDNVIVGFRPLLGNVRVEADFSNDLDGFQQDEPLKVKFQVDGLEYVEAPGFFNVDVSLSNQDDVLQLSQDSIKDLGGGDFELELPHPLKPDSYQLGISLRGSTKQGVEFGLGSADDETIKVDIAPYSAPRLTSFSVDQPVYWFDSLNVWFNVRKYNPSDEPSFVLAVYEEGKNDPVESARLSYQDAGKTDTSILYSWTSKNLTRVGNYRVVITSVEYNNLDNELNFSVGFSTTQKLLMGMAFILLAVLCVSFGISVYVDGQKVIGLLEYQKPDAQAGKLIRLSELNSHTVSIGVSHGLIFVPGKKMKDKVALFVGRSRGDRDVPPYLKVIRQKDTNLEIKVNYSLVQDAGYRRDLRDGDILTLGDYELIYKLPSSRKKTSRDNL